MPGMPLRSRLRPVDARDRPEVQSILARRFDALAGHYDTFFTRWIGEYELRQIRPLVPQGSTVLDYGCGTGRTTLDLLRRRCAVTAYDFSPDMVARGRERALDLGFAAEFVTDESELDGRTWPAITCVGVGDYYPDPQRLLLALRRYLASDGRLVMTYPNALSPLGWLYGLVSRFGIPVRLQTERRVRRAAQDAGWRVETARCAFPALRPFGMTLVVALTLT